MMLTTVSSTKQSISEKLEVEGRPRRRRSTSRIEHGMDTSQKEERRAGRRQAEQAGKWSRGPYGEHLTLPLCAQNERLGMIRSIGNGYTKSMSSRFPEEWAWLCRVSAKAP